jgi:hypothetical protein
VVKTDESKILSELAQFTGTTKYYKSSFGKLLLTDGIHYFRERLGAYWLIDVVESYQPMVKHIPFQLWSIDVKPDKTAVVEMREDTGLAAIVRQKISYTDFKLPQYEFYCIDGVVLLKSEY